MSRHTKVVLAGYALLVAAGGAIGAGTASSATTTVATDACRTQSLRVTLGQGEGALGHYYVPIVFINTGSTCTITGYPDVSYYAGTDQHQVGDAAAHEPGPTPTVVLRTGESAYAWLNQVNVDNYDPAVCKPLAVTGVRVYPPDNTSPVLLPEPSARGCALRMVDQRQLTVHAVREDVGP
jgi:hypothetical protein